MPWERSSISTTASPLMVSVNEGQPVPDSNLEPERNSGCPQPAQLYTPGVLVPTKQPTYGRSVPCPRSTAYSSAVSRERHSESLSTNFSTMAQWSVEAA